MSQRHHRVLKASCIAAALALAAAPLRAGTLHVPGDASTIQQAIELANGGDTIAVAPGTYLERIDLLGKKLILQSDGGAAVTTIDGEASGTVVTVDHVSPAGTTLRGFTITGGAVGTQIVVEGQFGYTVMGGGALYVGELSHLELEDCVITGNNLTQPGFTVGAGVGANRAVVTLRNCMLSHNKAQKGSALGDMTGSAEFRLFHCTVTQNTGTFSTGIAVYAHGGDGFKANDCFVTDNLGTGVQVADGIARITGCTFSGNTGWGCTAYGPVGVDLVDCRFLGNGLGGASCSAMVFNPIDFVDRCVFAGGDTLRPSGDATIRHCTFDGSHVTMGSLFTAEFIDCIARNGGALVQGSTHANVSWSDVQGGAVGVGNIDADPQWVDAAAHDYHLAPGSPCLNAGNPAEFLDADLTVADMGAFPLDGWNSLGGGTAAGTYANDVPYLAGQGQLVAGKTVGLSLSVMPPLTPTVLVIGLSQLGITFKGGTLWPSLDLLIPGLVTDAAGHIGFATTWPAGVPSGTTIRAQFLAPGVPAPEGAGISNAVIATAP